MKTVIQFPDKARVEQEAAAWIARLDRGALDDGEKATLAVWLGADPSHRQALEHMAWVWGDLDCMRILAELFPQESPAPRKSWIQWVPAGALGAAATVMLAVGLYLGGLFDGLQLAPGTAPSQKMPSELVYRTGLGEQSEIRLEDGSLLTLNTQSEARIRFDDSARSVYLNQGEAHFKVAKNPNLPFVVHAGQGQVRAVGTAFNVKLVDDQVEVLVDEGVVEVLTTEVATFSVRPADSAVPVRVAKGSAASYTSTVTPPETLAVAQVEQRLAWRKGKWMFEGETLAEVIAEVERYTDQKIIISDAAIANLRVGGYFDIGDIDGLMRALAAGFGVQVVRNGDTYRLEAGIKGEG